MPTKELDCGDGKGIACVWEGEGEARCCVNCLRSYADRLFDRIAYGETKARVTHALDNSSYGNGRDAVQGARDAIDEWAEQEDDPRPDDSAELARLTAVGLRKRSVVALEQFGTVYVARARTRDPNVFMTRLFWHPWSMCYPIFDNLGPIGCANVIQAEEAKRAAEWAGDKLEDDYDKLSRLTAVDVAKHVAALLQSDFADVSAGDSVVYWARRIPGSTPYQAAVSMHDPRFHGLTSSEIADFIRREEAGRTA